MKLPRLTPRKVAKLKRDIERIKKHSIGIFKICKNKEIVFLENKSKVRLNVIAISGPPEGLEGVIDEAILAEIGVSRTRPYREARGLNRTKDESCIPSRGKPFCLSAKQYQLVAPFVFKKIEELAYQRVSSWEKGPFSDDPFWIPSTWHFWKKKREKFKPRFVIRSSSMIAISGARFSISLKDMLFIQDIYWAELNLNKFIKSYLQGLVNFIDLRVNYEYGNRYKNKKPVQELIGVKQIREVLQNRSLSRHLLIEVVSRLKEEKRNMFSHDFMEMINWNGIETRERKLALSADSNGFSFHLRQRLNRIQLRVTTGLDAQKDYIVFEVYPQKK